MSVQPRPEGAVSVVLHNLCSKQCRGSCGRRVAFYTSTVRLQFMYFKHAQHAGDTSRPARQDTCTAQFARHDNQLDGEDDGLVLLA